MENPSNSINFEPVRIEDAARTASPAEYSASLDPDRYTVQVESPVASPEVVERRSEILASLEQPVVVGMVTQESAPDTSPERVRAQLEKQVAETFVNNGSLGLSLDRSPSQMSAGQMEQAIRAQENANNSRSRTIAQASAWAGAGGLIAGIMAPAVIGTTPALAAALPSIMTSVVTIGGVGLASSLVLLGGAGVGVAALGYGISRFKRYLDSKKANQARVGLKYF